MKVSMVLGAAPGIISGNPQAAAYGAGGGFLTAPLVGRRFAAVEKLLRGGPTRQAAAAKSAKAAATSPDAVIAAEQAAAAAAAPSPAAAAAAPSAPAARPRPQPIEIPPSRAAAPMPSAAGGGATAPAATGQEALAREMRFRDPEYWRTTDAVPIDALKPDSLGRPRTTIEPGESYLGLGDRMAALAKNPTPENVAEILRLGKALRQRGKITRNSPTKGKI